jgi:hypothetical protein
MHCILTDTVAIPRAPKPSQQDKVGDIEGRVQNMERNFVQQMKLLRLMNSRIDTVLPSSPFNLFFLTSNPARMR